jgi:hypothetical protein
MRVGVESLCAWMNSNGPMQATGLTVHRGALMLPTNLEPGDYLVEVRVIDVDADGQVIRLLPLQIVARN